MIFSAELSGLVVFLEESSRNNNFRIISRILEQLCWKIKLENKYGAKENAPIVTALCFCILSNAILQFFSLKTWNLLLYVLNLDWICDPFWQIEWSRRDGSSSSLASQLVRASCSKMQNSVLM